MRPRRTGAEDPEVVWYHTHKAALERIRVVIVCVLCGGTAACSADSPSDQGLSPNGSGGIFASPGGAANGGVTSVNGAGGVTGAGGVIGAGGIVAGGTVGSGGVIGATATGGSAGQGAVAKGGSAGQGGTQSCAPPPANATAAQVTAIDTVNAARLAAGAGCATEIATINTSAQNHCDYYAANTGSCIADAHTEVQGCAGFTGASFGDRMTAARYTGRSAFEVMAFSDDPTRAVAQWINSVWHRLPILNPWVTELGYGGATRCDTIDFGRGTPMPDDTVVVYPYDGQTGLPTSFDGSHEGPMPPTPSTGVWPSGSPITVWAKSTVLTTHTVTVDGDTTNMPHTYLTSADSNFLRDEVMIYTDAPFARGTRYRVTIQGTFVGGALDKTWTFTTQ